MIKRFMKLFSRPEMYAGRKLTELSLQITREKHADGICAECGQLASFEQGVCENGLTDMCRACGAVYELDRDSKPTKLRGFHPDLQDKYRKDQEEETRWHAMESRRMAVINLENAMRRAA